MPVRHWPIVNTFWLYRRDPRAGRRGGRGRLPLMKRCLISESWSFAKKLGCDDIDWSTVLDALSGHFLFRRYYTLYCTGFPPFLPLRLLVYLAKATINADAMARFHPIIVFHILRFYRNNLAPYKISLLLCPRITSEQGFPTSKAIHANYKREEKKKKEGKEIRSGVTTCRELFYTIVG